MKEKQLRRSLAVLPIGTVMKLTDLTARQIRYYEQQKLVHPERTSTNRRMYSLNDVDRLLEIKDYIDEGLTIKTIQEIYKNPKKWVNRNKKALSEDDVRQILYNEIITAGGFKPAPGERPRF